MCEAHTVHALVVLLAPLTTATEGVASLASHCMTHTHIALRVNHFISLQFAALLKHLRSVELDIVVMVKPTSRAIIRSTIKFCV